VASGTTAFLARYFQKVPPGRARAEGEKVSGPLSEDDEYEPDDYASSPTAAKLLRSRRRSFAVPIIVFAGVAVLGAIGFNRLDQLKPQPQNEAPMPPKRPDRFSEPPVKPIEPFKSLVLDTAQSYLVTRSLPAATPAGSGAKRDLPTKR
jgi:hypothetical protein